MIPPGLRKTQTGRDLCSQSDTAMSKSWEKVEHNTRESVRIKDPDGIFARTPPVSELPAA